MSIEEFLADQERKKPRQFKDAARRLLAEKESKDTREWKWEEEITDEDWNTIYGIFNNTRARKDWRAFASIAAALSQLDPSSVKISEQDWVGMKSLRTDTQSPKENRDLEKAMEILGPSGMKTYLDMDSRLQWGLTRNSKNVNWGYFAEVAKGLKLLYPQQELKLTKEEWDGMKSYLKSGLHWNDYTEHLGSMRILVAHKVEMTAKGLVITDTPSDQLDTTIPPRPVRKKI